MWEKRGNFTRPVPGSKTGRIWDILDKLHAKHGVVPSYGELWRIYSAQVPDAREGTARTQHSRWLGFHDLRDAKRQQKATAALDPQLSTPIENLLERLVVAVERIVNHLEGRKP